jgi:acyl carrier protein
MNVDEKVKTVLSQVMGVPLEEITTDSSPDTIAAWDSMKHMSLILTLEEECGIQFQEDQMVELVDLKSIIDIVTEAQKK